jgi:hypothetical protein
MWLLARSASLQTMFGLKSDRTASPWFSRHRTYQSNKISVSLAYQRGDRNVRAPPLGSANWSVFTKLYSTSRKPFRPNKPRRKVSHFLPEESSSLKVPNPSPLISSKAPRDREFRSESSSRLYPRDVREHSQLY